MTNKNNNPEIIKYLEEVLKPHPEACEFTHLYRDYVHGIDDLIDGEKRPTSEELLKMFSLASQLFTTAFWRLHGPSLLILEQTINNEYADSVLWETDAMEWKRTDSRVLRHSGISMFYAVLLLTVGREKLREVSAKFRENCHLLHMDEKGNTI